MLHVAAYKGCLQNLHSLHQNSDSQFVKYFFLFAALCSKKKKYLLIEKKQRLWRICMGLPKIIW